MVLAANYKQKSIVSSASYNQAQVNKKTEIKIKATKNGTNRKETVSTNCQKVPQISGDQTKNK